MSIDLKALIPVVFAYMDKGMTEDEALKALDIPCNSRAQLKYHVDRILNPDPTNEESLYTFIKSNPKPVTFVIIKGKRYKDVTAELIDCGG